MENKNTTSFEVFCIYSFRYIERDMHSIYLTYLGSTWYGFSKSETLTLRPIWEMTKKHHDGDDYVIRLMYGSVQNLEAKNKYIQLFLKSNKSVLYEETDEKQRPIAHDQSNFLFNVIFRENRTNRYWKLPPAAITLTKSQQLSIFSDYITSNHLTYSHYKFVLDSFTLCNAIKEDDMEFFLQIIIESMPYTNILYQVILKFNFNFLLNSKNDMLTYESTIEHIAYSQDFYKSIINYILKDLALEKKKNYRYKSNITPSEVIAQFTDKYDLLILGYFLKIKNNSKFIEYLKTKRAFRVEKLLKEIAKVNTHMFLNRSEIFDILSTFGQESVSSNLIAALVNLSENISVKIEIIFDEWKEITSYLKVNEKLNFFQMIAENEITLENMNQLLDKISERYFKKEDPANKEFSDVIDINICDIIKQFAEKCNELPDLKKLINFLNSNEFSTNSSVNIGGVKALIQGKIKSQIRCILQESGMKGYLGIFKNIADNYPEVLKEELSTYYSCKTILKQITGIPIQEIDQAYLSLFIEIKFHILLSPSNYQELIAGLLNKCQSFSSLLKLLSLFPKETIQESFSDDQFLFISQSVITVFSKVFIKHTQLDELSSVYLTLIEFICLKNESTYNVLFKKLCEKINHMPLEEFLFLQINLIEKIDSLVILESLFTCLTSRLKKITLKTAENVLSRAASLNLNAEGKREILSLTPKQYRLCLMIIDHLLDYIPREEDFYSKEMKDNLIFILFLIKSGLFQTECLCNSIFYASTMDIVCKVKSDLQKQKRKIDTILILKEFEPKDLDSKILLLCTGNIEEFHRTKSSILISLALAQEIKSSFVDVIHFCKLYFKDIPEMTFQIEELESLKEMINSVSLFEILQKHDSIYFLQKYSPHAERFIQLSHSEIFMKMLKKEIKISELVKNDDHIQLRFLSLNTVYEKFLSLKGLLTRDTFNSYSASQLDEVFSDITAMDVVLREIGYLKKYFTMESNTDYIEKTIRVLCTRNQTLRKIEHVQKIIEMFSIQHSQFIQDLEKDKDFLLQLNVNTLQYIQSYNKIISNGFDFIEDQDFFNLIEILITCQDLLQFLEGKTEDDIRGLIEFVDDIGDAFIKVENIRDLIKVFGFISALRSDNVNLLDLEFLTKFLNISKLEKNEKMIVYIHSVVANLNGIRQLYTSIVYREEFSKNKIKEIYTSSIFEFVQTDENDDDQNSNSNSTAIGYHINVLYGEQFHKKIEFDEIIELRDRSLLLSKKKILDESGHIFDEEQDRFIHLCLNFSQIVDEVIQLLDQVNELFIKGYPKSFVMKICVHATDSFVLISDQKKTLDAIKEEIKIILKGLNEELIEVYETYPLMTFFYGRQFQRIYDYILIGDLSIIARDSQNLMRYISNNRIESLAPIDSLPMVKSDDIRELFDLVNLYLTTTFATHNVALDKLLESNHIQCDHSPGIYCYLVNERLMEFEVLQAYIALTKNIPLFQTILLCNETTTMEQIISFIYRSFKYNYPVLFCIMKADCIDLEKRLEISNHVTSLYSRYGEEMKSSLVFVYSDRNSDLIDQVKKIKGWKNLSIEPMEIDTLGKYLKTCTTNIQVVYADASGIGKSTYIKRNAEANGYKYILFPLGGEITWNRLIGRLQELNATDEIRKNDKTVLHVDLSETYNLGMLRDFLFSFLITRGVSYKDNIFLLTHHVKIALELPYGFVNYLQKFPLLTLLSTVQISKTNLPKMLISSDLMSNEQITANYLLYYKLGVLTTHNMYISCQCDSDNHYGDCPKKVSIPLTLMEDDKCSGIILKYFDIKHPTYYQLTAFINVLADQFRKLSASYYFDVQQLTANGAVKNQNLLAARPLLINSLIELTKYFTSGAYVDLIESQDFTYSNLNVDYDSEEKQEEEHQRALDLLQKKKIITFDQIPFSLVFFNEDGQSISIITTADKNSDEYKILSYLWSSGSVKNSPLIDYRTLNHSEFIWELGHVLGKTVYPEDTEGYVFTVDNFIKMILILLRIRAKIPVIMMGETGCGKTSLIKIISKFKDNNQSLKVLNIHAGITDDNIIHFMKEEVIPFAAFGDDNIWVFFDEINTCNSMGLISEIICKHTMQGIKLPDQIILIAACNPYRKISSSRILEVGLVNKREHLVRQLVYNVNPLPHSLLNFVFDFGNLTLTDEERYVESMLRLQIFNGSYLKLAVNAIIMSQNFIRTINEVSSVSLRDVRRFVIFYQWFTKSIGDRKAIVKCGRNYYRTSYYLNIDEEDTIFRAIALSIFICYYLRISEKQIRDLFLTELELTFNNSGKHVTKENIERIFFEEQLDLVKRISPPKGIALNTALLENLFTVFVCINNKIPVFLCGKPGCSKTLSVQLLYSSMRGQDSNDEYFRKLPRLFMNCYQGSMTSTSSGVLKIFQKARNILKDENSKDYISMVFFDEMGLAEISRNNPLKVIHAELEYDENKTKVAFVGISNWRLDASKMNRGIFLSRPDPDEDDLIKTAITIADSYEDDLMGSNYDLFRALAQTYFRYKNQLRSEMKAKEDFHGTRDFYHLVKQVARRIIKHSREGYVTRHMIEKIAEDALERNFGGLSYSIEMVKSIYREVYPNYRARMKNEYDVMNCIKDNIQDEQSRYLILITKSSISPYLLQSILNELKVSYAFYIGSKFANDVDQEDYSFKILNQVQICMEQGKMLILQNLEMIYPSLYDLFNQNFNRVGGKNYARIALGISNNPMALVNENFRCVILLDEEELESQDPPFLNRFEKHIISFEVLLPQTYIQLAKDISHILKSLVTPREDIKTSINLTAQLVNCDDEEILGMIYYCINKKITTDHQKIITYVLNKIIPTFSQDIIACSKISCINTLYNQDLLESIYDCYAKCGDHRNLESYLNSANNPKHLVYTFSSILDRFEIGKNHIRNSIIGEADAENMEESTVSAFKTENELSISLINFYKNPKKKIYILKFRPIDLIHMNLVKFLIDNIQKENDYVEKIIIFTLHMSRLMEWEELTDENTPPSKKLISHLSDYTQIFIDNLNSKFTQHITGILQYDSSDFFSGNSLFNFDENFKTGLYPSLMKINYTFLNGEPSYDYRNSLIDKILSNPVICKEMKSVLFRHLGGKSDVLTEILTKKRVMMRKDADLITMISMFLNHIFQITLTKLLVYLERAGGIEFSLDNDKFLLDLWTDHLQEINLLDMNVSNNNLENQVIKVHGLKIPFIQQELSAIVPLITEYSTQYFKYEEQLRVFDDNFFRSNFFTDVPSVNHKPFIASACREFQKSLLCKRLLERDDMKNNQLESFESILSDYIKYYIGRRRTVCKDSSEKEKLIRLLIDLRFEKEEYESSLEYLGNVLLWLEGYGSIIQTYLRIVDHVMKYHKDISGKVSEIIQEKNVYYSTTHDKFKKKVNEAFFLLHDSLLFICLSVKNIFDKFTHQQFYEYLNDMKNVSHECENLEANLALSSQELIEFRSYIQFLGLLDNKNNLNLDLAISKGLLLEILEFKERENRIFKEKCGEEMETSLIELVDEQLNFFQNTFDNYKLKEFPEFLCDNFLYGKFQKLQIEKYRLKLITFILSKTEFIQSSKNFIELCFQRFQLIPKSNIDDSEEYSQDSLQHFCSFALETDLCLHELEKTNHMSADEILTYLFEMNILNYFEKIRTEDEIIYGLSLKYFDKCLLHLHAFSRNENIFHYVYPRLALLYSIAFIKIYLMNFARIVYYRNSQYNFTRVHQSISRNENNPVTRMIKLYLLKCLRFYMASYDEFRAFDFHFHQINWIDEFNSEETMYSSLDYLYFSLEKKEVSQNMMGKIMDLQHEAYQSANSCDDVIKLINEGNLISFYDVTVNKIFCDSVNFDYGKDKALSQFSYWACNLLEGVKLSDNTRRILNLFYSNREFVNRIHPILQNSELNIEMIFHSYKLALTCYYSSQDTFYGNLTNHTNIFSMLNSYYIPGAEQEHIKLLHTYHELKSFLDNRNLIANSFAYLCSCGFWYTVGNCGAPIELSKCIGCGLDIGGTGTSMVNREGHYRVYKDSIEKEQAGNQAITGILLEEIKIKVDEIMKNEKPGLKKVSKSTFVNINKTVRNMKGISYRLLSLMLYSIVFYGNLRGMITDEEMALLVIENMTCMEVIEHNWKSIRSYLLSVGINSMTIFMNVLYDKLSLLMSSTPIFTTAKERDVFEDQVNQLCEATITAYPKLSSTYHRIHNEYVQSGDIFSLKSLIEKEDLKKEVQEIYPYMRYFRLSTYPSEENMRQKLFMIEDYLRKYPVLSNFINLRDSIMKLENVNKINQLVNFMINHYSYKISRNEAKELLIKDEIHRFKDKHIHQLFARFQEGWNNIYQEATVYQCNRREMIPKFITENDSLSHILNDDGDFNHGMYLASAYQKFIQYQNGFILNILENITQSGIVTYYQDSLRQEVIVQEALPSEILSLKLEGDLVSLANFSKTFSFRKVGSGSYRNITYAFDKIEEKLSKLILPGIKLLSEKQKFVIYAYEAYRGEKSAIMLTFKQKIPQDSLNTDEKNQISLFAEESKQFDKYLSSLQILIFYLHNTNFFPYTAIYQVINDLPSYIAIDKDISRFFESHRTLTLAKLLEIYESIEIFCYEKIVENVSDDYKLEISQELKDRINDYFNARLEVAITRKILASVVRKFVSRYLSGKMEKEDINVNENCLLMVRYRPDLWEKCVYEDKRYLSEIESLREKLEVKVNQAVAFYSALGGDVERKKTTSQKEQQKKQVKKKGLLIY